MLAAAAIAGTIRANQEKCQKHGAGSENRTRTWLPIPDFESGASTSSATPAAVCFPRPLHRSDFGYSIGTEGAASIDNSRLKNYCELIRRGRSIGKPHAAAF